jgi:hypothetical protein
MTTILAQDDSILAWFGGEREEARRGRQAPSLSLLLQFYRMEGNYYAKYFSWASCWFDVG